MTKGAKVCIIINVKNGEKFMPKFFVKKEDILDNSVKISGQDASHIAKVLRLASGDEITLCDGEGIDYLGKIEKAMPDEVVVSIESALPCPTESKISVTVFQCLPKAAKMDFIIEKCTELGASGIVPVSSARCVVKIEDSKKEEKKLSKWQKCADEAAKQCKRGVIPTVSNVISLAEAADMIADFDLVIHACEFEEKTSLKAALTQNIEAKKIGIFIGPEGGWEMAEAELLKEKGAVAVTLGKRILRTETAGICVLSAVMYELGGF